MQLCIYQEDDISGGQLYDVGAGDHAWATPLNSGLDSVDRVEAVAGEGLVVLGVLLGVVVLGRYQDGGVTALWFKQRKRGYSQCFFL
jgi:hypothetical protein